MKDATSADRKPFLKTPDVTNMAILGLRNLKGKQRLHSPPTRRNRRRAPEKHSPPSAKVSASQQDANQGSNESPEKTPSSEPKAEHYKRSRKHRVAAGIESEGEKDSKEEDSREDFVPSPSTMRSSMETCQDEVSYAVPGVVSAFTPVPKQQQKATKKKNRGIVEQPTQSDRSPCTTPPTEKKGESPYKSGQQTNKDVQRLALSQAVHDSVTSRASYIPGQIQRRTPARTPRKGDAALNQRRLEAVDSEIFDTAGPFRPSYALGTYGGAHVGAPYEISSTPIEVNESRKQQIQNREPDKKKPEPPKAQAPKARLESQNDYACLSPMPAAMHEELDQRCKSPQLVEMHTFRDAVDVNYQRMAITGEELSGVPLEDLKEAASHLIEALRMRNQYMERIGNQFPITTKRFLSGEYPANLPKYRRKNTESSANTSFNPPEPPKDHWGLNTPLPVFPVKYTLQRNDGVVVVCGDDGKLKPEFAKYYITKDQFLADTERLTQMIVDGPLKSFCYRRLSYLQNKFQLHVLLNELRELHEQKAVSHRDFYNIRKVDTHIHAASSMNQKHLLRFIKKKIRTEANTVVLEKNKQQVTMKEVFKKMGIDAYDLSVDMLDVHADRNTFHRFDKFNTKYNPVGESTLREIFIKTDNYVGGKYFAEVLKEVLSDLEDSKYQHAEPRLSIYGRSKDEWDKLAKWAITHDVWSPNVRWLIQIPRLYDIYKAKNMVQNFDELLDNIFTPLFEVTNDPSSHPDLYRFLQQVSGIDSVDDESKHEFVHFDRSTPPPQYYKDAENPPYNYYLFYMYANLTALNAFRR
ncbi:hypothetical protein Q1695_002950 [Nippostrongylus brasiliensis]|nr:hypothetical protein Q1695_002950 [Nippostrongylus brasiliensis]